MKRWSHDPPHIKSHDPTLSHMIPTLSHMIPHWGSWSPHDLPTEEQAVMSRDAQGFDTPSSERCIAVHRLGHQEHSLTTKQNETQ